MKFSIILATLLSAGLSTAAHAEEGGSGHYLPGSMASFVDGLPARDTFVARYNMIHYHGTLSLGGALPIAGLQAVDATATSWAHGATLLYAPSLDLGDRWTYAFCATIPFVMTEVSARVTTGAGAIQRTQSVSGLGDIVLMPVMLNYKVSPDLNVNFRLGAYAPTGRYTLGQLANTGKNYWSLEPTLGLMYFGQKNGREASLFLGSTFNYTNAATHYRTGTQAHVELTLAQHFPLWGGLFGLGLNTYWYEQITGDTGTGARYGAFKGRTAGLGPVVSHVFQLHGVNLVAEVKWLHETETRRRLEGDTVWFKLVAKF